jgi:MYXO-CTERM domain-containing protein
MYCDAQPWASRIGKVDGTAAEAEDLAAATPTVDRSQEDHARRPVTLLAVGLATRRRRREDGSPVACERSGKFIMCRVIGR